VVTDLLDGRVHHAANTVAFLCGPEIMMRFCAYALLDRGFLPEQIFVSLELNMKCALGMCGRCQYGPFFICKDGPVFSFAQVARLFRIREM
jgi:NAD(P)H-flavin reductase